MEEIHLYLGQFPDVVVFRNHVGAGYVHNDKGTRFERWGLHPGSSDLICCVAPHGRWLCIEVKSAKGRERPEQKEFRALMTRFGAVCGVARSTDEALALVMQAREAPIGRSYADWAAGA